SSNPKAEKAGKVTSSQLREIAASKLSDLNTNDIDAAMKIIAGTARNMGIEIID
ncbi:MAG: 50S ribosomal protein L11, partial [Thermodesulfobacteriota bacterium]|nr:50S ribosomal protein L11 [Thermodesulfobacteriota bacterium]